MKYTVSQAAKITGLSAHALRYYDNEGLLPFVDKSASGVRVFKESDFEWLALISCFKRAGMSIKQIKSYIEWCMEGDSTLESRLEAMKKHKESVVAKMSEMEKCLETINHKIQCYEAAIEAKAESVRNEKTAV